MIVMQCNTAVRAKGGGLATVQEGPLTQIGYKYSCSGDALCACVYPVARHTAGI